MFRLQIYNIVETVQLGVINSCPFATVFSNPNFLPTIEKIVMRHSIISFERDHLNATGHNELEK
jgi:hypothetical protein